MRIFFDREILQIIFLIICAGGIAVTIYGFIDSYKEFKKHENNKMHS